MTKLDSRFLSKFDVISFDIFDTLLLRPYVKATDLWRDLEVREGSEGFFKARLEADQTSYRIASAARSEATIDDAYDLIPQWAAFKQKELDLERKVLAVNPEMAEVWRLAGKLCKRRVIVSDMYLPATFLKEVLISRGIDGWSGFYVSSDLKKGKTSGLYCLMLDEQNDQKRPCHVLHIGDSVLTDVEAPGRLGIATIHYAKVIDRFVEEFRFVKCFMSAGHGFERERMVGALALGWHLNRCNGDLASYWERIGFLLGGTLAYAYVSWIVKSAKARNVSRLLFVGRDGYIWLQICERLFPEMKADYVYAPRSTSLLLLGDRTENPVAVAFLRRGTLSVLSAKCGIVLSEGEKEEYLNKGVLPPFAQKALDSASAVERDLYGEYLRQHVDKAYDDVALVDGCSAAFSAQRLFENVLDAPMRSYYLMAMSPMKQASAFYYTPFSGMPFHALTEFLFGAPTPSVRSVDAERVEFSDVVDVFEQYKIDHMSELAKGAVAAAEMLKKVEIKVSPTDWFSLVTEFMRCLSGTDRELFSFARNSFEVNHTQGHAVLWNPLPIMRTVLSIKGVKLLTVRYHCENGILFKNLMLLDRWKILTREKQLFLSCFESE